VDSAARNAAPKSEPPITALNHVASDLLAMPLNRIERFLGKPNGERFTCGRLARFVLCTNRDGLTVWCKRWLEGSSSFRKSESKTVQSI